MVSILNYILLLSGKSTHLSGTSLADMISEAVTEIVKSKSPSEDGKIHVDYSEVKDILGNILKANYPYIETYTVGSENLAREKILELTHEALVALINLKK